MSVDEAKTDDKASDVDETRAAVRAIMDTEGLSQAAAARACGVAYGTFSSWLAGTYQGRNEKVAQAVRVWLAARDEQRQAAAAVPSMPGYVATQSAANFAEALRFAQIMPEISVVAGGAGIGKTTACQHYAATTPNVWLATMDPSSARTYAMLAELAEVMGVFERSSVKVPRAIGRRIAGSQGLIIVDEAQHLQPGALDMLRSLFDRYQIGIALVGNETVYARLEGEGRKASFAQLYSRIGVRVTQSRPRVQDIEALAGAWGIVEAEELKVLKVIARKPGGLRGLTKCLQLASMIAAAGSETRGLSHIRAAWSRLSSNTAAEAA